MQGLNITITIKRDTPGAKDAVGGATTAAEATIATGVKARISNLKPTEEMRAQGLEVDKLYNMVIQPPTTDIQEGDKIEPESGVHLGRSFRVKGVQISSLLPSSDRAHLSVRLQRTERARSVF